MLEDLRQALPYILEGVQYTVGLTVIGLAIGLVIGWIIAMLRVYGGRFLQGFAAGYVVVLRGYPTLVILFFVYFMLARYITLIDLPPFSAGCVALGVASSAYQAEIFRGAIQSVPPGQMQAARALGLSQRQAIFLIILPQALRNAIPGWSNEAAVVVKDSSLVYAVGLPELMRRSQQVSARLYAPLLVFSLVGAIYFLLTFGANRLLGWLERATRVPEMSDTR